MSGQAVGHRGGSARPSADRCVMGVVNVTPDSFSDGGHWFDPDAAIAHGRRCVAEGADLVDVGGESTRPGAERPSARRSCVASCRSSRRSPTRASVVSVDTMRAEVAAAGPRRRRGARQRRERRPGRSRHGPAGRRAAAVPTSPCTGAATAPRCRALARSTTTSSPRCARARPAASALVAGGVDADRIVLDPGFGFAKHAPHNWALLAPPRRARRPRPAGARRGVAQDASSAGVAGPRRRRPATERDAATAATSALAAPPARGRVRVHEARRPPTPSASSPAAAARRSPTRRRRSAGASGTEDDRIRLTRPAWPGATTASSPPSGATARTSPSTWRSSSTCAGRPRPTTSPGPCTTGSWPAPSPTTSRRTRRPAGDPGRAAAADLPREPPGRGRRGRRAQAAGADHRDVRRRRRHRPAHPGGAVPAARDGVLALGSNLGDRERTLAAAVADLAATPGLEVVAVSPVVETAPVGRSRAAGLPQRGGRRSGARSRPMRCSPPASPSRPGTAGSAGCAGAPAPWTST